jgi:dienelactone hydrolase
MLICATASGEDLRVAPVARRGEPKRLVHDYLMRLACEALDRRAAAFEKLKTLQDVAAWQESRRQFFIQSLGGLPTRTPLNARVVARQQRNGYRLEKVIYESQPKHFVTALLYLPASKPPFPGVLVPCGHSDNGKAHEPYQRVCILLAMNGMAALCYDPIDQGERCQLPAPSSKPQAGGTVAHCLLGVGSLLLGRNTATFRVWDGIRGLDYLESRADIDPRRLGCTGNSGGGTLTSYLMALDGRIACAAPSCYLCGFRRLLATIGPQDAEQNIHAQIAFGMDHADYLMMRAPRPTLMCTATRDYFAVDGAWDAFRQAKRVYTRLGAPENIEIAEADEKHGFTLLLRQSAVQWLRRWLLKIDAPVIEPAFPVLGDKEALCTPQGQVMLLDGARSAFDLNRDEEEACSVARRAAWRKLRPREALDEVRRLTGIRRLDNLPPPKAENVGHLQRDGYRIDKLVIETDCNIWLPALLFVPERPITESVLYLHEDGKQADAAAGGPIEKLVREGKLVLTVDLRGAGEMQAGGGGSYAKYLGPEWADGFLADMLARPYLSMRAEDVLQTARWLATQSEKPGAVRLVSIGRVGPPALHAAALEPRLFTGVRLHGCLHDWSQVVGEPLAHNQFINVVYGALRFYDLPDLAATLPRGQLTISEPLDALERPWKR